MIVCPGYVGTDVTPGFFKLFTPFLTHARYGVFSVVKCVVGEFSLAPTGS